ncbi:hypothetical protein [Salinispora arenicola]|uniref:Uncharacterized protein n=1 Tax=Salinispora arenicola TaxID=168697 RepID=A0ABQ4JKA0_SALAC|nr:hypothetical protein [Salinispora arenicola]GIM81329.1 hypothetical protein Sar04_01630 [Salinispora arenicola]
MAAALSRLADRVIEVVTGVDAIRHRFAQVQHAARVEVRSFVTAPFVAVPPGTTRWNRRRSDRACGSGW